MLMNQPDYLALAQVRLSNQGGSVETFRILTNEDFAAARTYALVSIAESLQRLADGLDLKIDLDRR